MNVKQHQESIPEQNELGRIERLEILADLWGKIYLFHPEVVRGALDCEQLLLDILPEVEAANTAVELAATLNRLLRALEDSLTFVTASGSNEGSVSEPFSGAKSAGVVSQLLTSSVGYVDRELIPH